MNNEIILANIFSTFLVKKFGIDPIYGITVSSIIGKKLSEIEYTKINFPNVFSWYNGIYLLVFIMISLLIYRYRYYLYNKLNGRGKYNYITLYDADNTFVIRYFMDKNKEFFTTPDLEYGNNLYPGTKFVYFPEVDTVIDINDTLHNVQGYITIGVTITKLGDHETHNRYMRMYIKQSCIRPLEYLELLKKYKHDDENKTNKVRYYSVTVTGHGTKDSMNHHAIIYEGSKDNHEEQYKKFMDSYFSTKKELIWNNVKNVHFNPDYYYKMGQIPSYNMLLYGPPGTGKSTLAYRLAMSLGRHLVNLNLLDFTNDKSSLYQILINPHISGYNRQAKTCIFLLEEFDNTVRYLNSKDNDQIDKDNDQTKGKSKEKSVKKTVRREGEKSITNFITGRNPNELVLYDLLELLQGAIPIDGSIVIATTNNYKYIKKTLPALTRPGRLTPIHIDYLDWNSLQDLSMFYFNELLTIPEQKITYPTAGIIDFALECKQLANPVEEFEKRLKSVLS